MYMKQTKIVNATGLHARPASEFVNCAKEFTSSSYIARANDDNAKKANCKSIILVLSLGLTQNTDVTISAQGEDEKEALDALVKTLDTER